MAALRARLASAEQEARSWESKAVEADATALKAENARAAVRNRPSPLDSTADNINSQACLQLLPQTVGLEH